MAATLTEADLSAGERRLLAAFVALVSERLGEGLRSVWLYGSRARGERVGPDSDVDLLVVVDRAGPEAGALVQRLLLDAAEETGGNPMTVSARVWDDARVAHERTIGSFFMQDVDRDKIVLAGPP